MEFKRTSDRWMLSRLVGVFLGLLTLSLALSDCGDPPVVVLNITYTAQENRLLVRTLLNGMVGQDQTVPSLQQRVSVLLPSGASGSVKFDLYGLGRNGCKVSHGSLTLNVPGGLSGATEVPIVLLPLPVNLCTVTVAVSGTGTVTSTPPGIVNCTSDKSGRCSSDFDIDTQVLLTASPSYHSVVKWGGPCTGSANTCSVAASPSQSQVTASFSALSCSPDNWCTQIPPVQGNLLRAVTGFNGTDAIVVGHGGTVLRCSGAGCSPLTSNTTQDLVSVWGSDSNNIYTVGYGGMLLRCATASNSCTPLNYSTFQFHGIWGSDASNVYAVGRFGTVARCAAGSNDCVDLAVSGSSYLIAAWGSDAKNVYVVGGSTIERCAANSNSCMLLSGVPMMRNFLSVWGSDASNVYAVGDMGAILRCAAGSPGCVALTSNTTQVLNSVWGSDASNVYAVGAAGAIVRCSAAPSTSCTALASGTPQALVSVWGSDAANVYAVGAGGTIMRCSAGSPGCTALTSNTTQVLSSVWGSDANHIWAVGSNGAVLFYWP